MALLKKITQFLTICFILGLLVLAALYIYVKPDLPSVKVLKDVQLQTPMQVFTRDGKLINQFGEKRRIPVSLDEIPKPLLDAFLATEDNRFYDHFGIDPIGILRSFFVLVSTGEKKQGASTITMQLARNFFLTREKAYIRKVKEIFIALHIESLLSKDEILTLYLNKIPLGHRAFGIGAAAQVYYGKKLDELTLAQMATIAGLPKAPSSLNPISHPARSKARRAVVLMRMLDEGYITSSQFEEAKAAPVTAKRHGAEIELYAPYISEMVRAKLVAEYGLDKAYNSGLRVYTTVDAKTQKAAQQALMDNLHAYDMRHGYRGVSKQLWQPNETPWTAGKMLNTLKNIPAIGQVQPAIVTELFEQSATVLLQDGRFVSLEWDGLKWARPFLSTKKQGPSPQNAADILTVGAQIYVREPSDNRFQLSQIPDASSALVALSPKNGHIKALVGGYSFAMSQFNRATQAKRQVGSNIKPFVYSAALEKGYTLASIINDAPINHWDKSQGVAWRPRNSPEEYDGPIRVRQALAKSKNVVSVRLMRGVGLDHTALHLEKFGFSSDDIHRNESLALGSASLTPLELARGTAAFANGGHLVDSYFIERIEDANGQLLHQAQPLTACKSCSLDEINSSFDYAPRVVSEQNAFLIADAMTSVVWGGGNWNAGTGWNGTGWRAQKLKRRDLSGKTGTTNDQVDTWFTGFNQDILATVWVGFDNPGISLGRASYDKNMGRSQLVGTEAGAISALPAWVDFMEVALEDTPEAPIEPPNDVVSVRIDLETGLLSNSADHTSRFEYFIKGTAPTQYVDVAPPKLFEPSNNALEEEIF